MSLDLALDVGPGLKPGRIQWPEQLISWIEAVRSDAQLTCPQAVRTAEEVSLGLRFTDDSTIAELNNHWRQRAESTDVLSFAALEEAPALPDVSSVELGDIVVSVETAHRQAEEQGHSLERELRWLVSHGLLHLLGWDHPDDSSLAAMLSLQEHLLAIDGSVQPRGEGLVVPDPLRDAH